jgi:AraC-like DNA-binding protein
MLGKKNDYGGRTMIQMKLNYFTNDDSFPFFIQYGSHEEDLFIHTHEDFSELVIVLEGHAAHIVDEEEFQIQKGDVFVIGNNTSHGYRNTENFHICNIMYRLNYLFPGDYDITRSAGFHALFLLEPYFSKEYRFVSRLKLDQVYFDKIYIMIDRMVEEYNDKLEGWHTSLQSTFMAIVVLLSRIYNLNANVKKTDIMNIAKAVSYIENHFIEDISIQLLAELAHYSKRHFIRIFSDTYQTTPVNYIITLKIRYACNLLKEGNLPISSIALRCGFNDSNYFCRVFKKHMNITPTQYRREYYTR